MKRIILPLLLLIITLTVYSQTHSIIPCPVSFTEIAGEEFIPDSNTVITYNCESKELQRLGDLVGSLFPINLNVYRALPQNDPTLNHFSKQIRLVLDCKYKIPEEGYELIVNSNSITLTARTNKGIFYGIQTLSQLIPSQFIPHSDSTELAYHGNGNINTFQEAQGFPSTQKVKIIGCKVSDYPRFGYRGMHLDVCRHMFSVDFIKRYIDVMAFYKMNNFHWHLTDDQGWRLEIKAYPLLTQKGAWRSSSPVKRNEGQDSIPYGGYYTQEEARDIVEYAAARYINVIPEIEMPGHATAALASYPELSCTGGPFETWTLWGVNEDIFCAGNEQTFTFIENVLTEIMDIFPSTYIHVGGDEAPKTRWEACNLCRNRMAVEHLKSSVELQSYFIQRIEKFLNAHDRQIIGWDEILEGGLAKGATVMSWRGFEGGIAAAKMKHNVIMTPGSHCYLDYYQGDPVSEPFAIGGYNTLENVYSFKPIPPDLSKRKLKYILGAQGNVWTEYITTAQQVEYMAFPRAIALAEVNWSSVGNRNYKDFLRRLNFHFNRFDRLNINYCKSPKLK